jgi:predicted metal-dependent enzyme (double-stranded beta helix superfamily)
MLVPLNPLSQLIAICNRWSEKVVRFTTKQARIEFFQKELPGLLLNKRLFTETLNKIAKGETQRDLRQAMMFENEYLLYLNSSRLFSLRMYIFEPGEYTWIHDHNSWGVLGNVTGSLEVIRYIREDDGSKEKYARLGESDRSTLVPGETELTFPLNAGIHQTGNPTAETIIMISVYGPPLRRLYINCFDLNQDRIFKLYPLRLKKKMLASQALKTLMTYSCH